MNLVRLFYPLVQSSPKLLVFFRWIFRLLTLAHFFIFLLEESRAESKLQLPIFPEISQNSFKLRIIGIESRCLQFIACKQIDNLRVLLNSFFIFKRIVISTEIENSRILFQQFLVSSAQIYQLTMHFVLALFELKVFIHYFIDISCQIFVLSQLHFLDSFHIFASYCLEIIQQGFSLFFLISHSFKISILFTINYKYNISCRHQFIIHIYKF